MIRTFTCILATLAALVAATGASAADPATLPSSGGGVTLTEVDASRFPIVRAAFGADEVKGRAPKLTFFENGEQINGVSMYRGDIGSFENDERSTLMLVLDTSLSMEGSRFDDAIAAANALIDQARKGDHIGLATFGGKAEVIIKPTEQLTQVREALGDLKLENQTTMFDAVALASEAFNKSDTRRAIVLLSDGADVGSALSLDEAAGAALKARAPIFAISIREDASENPSDMANLGNGTGGEARTIADTSSLDDLFSDLGRRLLQPYWIEYRSNAPTRSQVALGLAVGDSSAAPIVARSFTATPATSSVPVDALASPRTAKPAEPLIAIPGGTLGMLIVVLPFAALVFIGAFWWLERRSTPDIVARIDQYTTQITADQIAQRNRPDRSLIQRVGAPFVTVSESFLGRSAYFAKIRRRAEQANIAIKPSELFAAMLGCAFLGALITAMLGANFLLLLATMFVLGFAPDMWLRLKARKRRKAFEDQLPDVLQGISSSLKAGHSFHQAMNAMVKDAPSPTNEEFSRVMTESRLGMPIEDALQNMAERMGSADFEFAVTTVNIQRTVGGSLADILEMVGDTVRNRQQFRKKVKALSSMGQMSAYVLLAMPIFIGGVIGLMSPEYMAPLFTTTAGHFMMVAGAISMFLGYLACMKIVNIKV